MAAAAAIGGDGAESGYDFDGMGKWTKLKRVFFSFFNVCGYVGR